ncbi:MAG TPA: DinB family protein [Chryseosolibacter sp.]|nr:DinB family protein [Chryseosolibacter sp.]
MSIQDFNHTIDTWIKELDRYDYKRLCAKPAPHGWSMGQLYMHLLEDTKFYMEQIEICVSSNEHENEEPSADGKTMLANNDFPNAVLEGAPSNAFIPQPENKDQLLRDMLNLKAEMNRVSIRMSKSPFKGKTRHPGLDYFNARDWLQFAEMHLRHHFRQKKRIDDFLRQTENGSAEGAPPDQTFRSDKNSKKPT